MLLKYSIISVVLFMSQSLTTAFKCDEHGYTNKAGLSWYKFHTKAKNWLEASATCTQEGAHLAIIDSEEEQQVINDMFEKNLHNIRYPTRNDLAWLGGHKILGKKKNEWVTVFGKPLSSSDYENWSTGCNGYPPEPNNYYGDEFCLSVLQTCDQGWNDQPCDTVLAFVCEKFDTCK